MDGPDFTVTSMVKPFAVRDGCLIAGQEQVSGIAAAALATEALGR